MSDNYTAYLPACFLQLPKLTRHEWMPGLVPCTLPLKLHEVPLGVLPAQRRGDLICLYPDLGSRGQEVGSGALGEEAVLVGTVTQDHGVGPPLPALSLVTSSPWAEK